MPKLTRPKKALKILAQVAEEIRVLSVIEKDPAISKRLWEAWHTLGLVHWEVKLDDIERRRKTSSSTRGLPQK